MVEGKSNEVKKLGRIKTISVDGDLKLGKEVVFHRITNKQDEIEAVKLSQTKTLIIEAADWKVIPLENLIAQKTAVFLSVKTSEEARTAFQILE